MVESLVNYPTEKYYTTEIKQQEYTTTNSTALYID